MTMVQESLLKAYEEQSTSDALSPPRKSNRQFYTKRKAEPSLAPLFLCNFASHHRKAVLRY
jgi:hypothetical protein